MHFGASAVGQMGGAATQAMPLRIFQERQQSRCRRAAAPLWAGVRRNAGVVIAPYIPQRVCVSLSPSQRIWGPQQSVSVTSWQTLSSANEPRRTHDNLDRLWVGYHSSFLFNAPVSQGTRIGPDLSLALGSRISCNRCCCRRRGNLPWVPPSA